MPDKNTNDGHKNTNVESRTPPQDLGALSHPPLESPLTCLCTSATILVTKTARAHLN